MEGYETFKMIDWGWVLIYQQKMGIDLFRSYRDDVYALLLGMNPGDSFDIDSYVKFENIELFIKIVCSFISEGNYNYDFTKDYKKVRCHSKSDMDFKRKRISTGKLGKDDSCSNSEISEKNRECGNMLCSSKALEPYSESQKEPP